MSTPAELEPPVTPESLGRLRLVMLTRKFWPYSGAAEQQAADLALQLADQGHSVDVLTVRWSSHWPTFFHLQNIGVHRLVRPNSGPWGAYRYSRGITREVISCEPDGLFVFGLGHELTTAHRYFGHQIPYVVVLNELDLGNQSDVAKLNHRQLKALAGATAIICESRWTYQRLAAHSKLDDTRMTIAADGISSHIRTVSAVQRNITRRALADVHPMLVVPEGQPLVACFSPFVGDEGLLQLVAAWRWVFKKLPNARLWLIGEGPRSREVWDAIVDAQMTETVIMPGEFDLLEDIAVAADLIVHNLETELFCSQFLRAYINGSAAIVRQPLASLLQLDADDAVIVDQLSAKELGGQILDLLADPSSRDQLSLRASEHSGRFQLSDRIAKFVAPIYAAIRRK